MDRTTELVAQLHAITAELGEIHGRRFTPDGHLVGTLGEVLAASKYGLTLAPPSTKGYDAVDRDGRKVEIKATYGTSVALRASSHQEADDLLVLRLDLRGAPELVYYGPIARVAERPVQSNGQFSVSLSTLRRLRAE
ncbi:hypothetical protein HWD35_19225 [Tsukamurella tyrosinosolvens]|uniref:DUF6998 domain-containing protein n=1 Tax=Tsukamurella tyrosinosolvens TaxID=57704 RepID=A0A1H4Q2K7_TSUTY|nr:hypothetical protein [Tsukamurella tyrosinosolvens]KXO97511.1 hypothetical protein AXK58_09915 [Tsukamurella tyrosinosolvens]KXP09015.1 hypothetical protein AXK59_00965 [Tsukamurella tyrosinosolvens]KZL97243.1 hypothetical protein AXX05_17505 [Tsukamurella tyrosinosolvens]MCA4996852.1 hypothetical protein [Tsukamurella tyrosinosolvens]MEC4615986.1 hypothetical protein [Tsukamurella tyrosinosolvens]